MKKMEYIAPEEQIVELELEGKLLSDSGLGGPGEGGAADPDDPDTLPD